MQNLKILLKYDLLKLLNIFRGKKREKSIYVGIFALVLSGLGILALYTIQAWSMFQGLAPLGLAKVCLFHGFMVAIILLFVLAIMRSVATKKQGDSELLMSLPLRKSEIVLSKTFSKYAMDFAFSFALILPFFVLYQIYEGFDILQLLSTLVLVFILPLFSVGVSYVFSFIITRVFNRSKYSDMLKSLTATILMIVVLALLFTKTFGYGTVNPLGLAEYFADRPITSQLMYFALNEGFLPKVYILLLCIIPFAIGLMLYAKNFGRDFVGYASTSNTLKFTEKKSGLFGLLRKEASFYFSSPAYVSNTLIGPLLILAFGFMIGVFGGEKVLGVIGDQALIVGLVGVIICALSSTTMISCSSISLEGKQFWILKSSPINVKVVFLAKTLLNFFIIIIPSIIAITVLSIALKFSVLDFVMLLILALIFALIVSAGGLLLNLVYPKMNWENETQPIKQGLASLLTMLGGMMLSLIPVVIYLIFTGLTPQIVLSICLVFYAIVAVAIALTLHYKGEKLFAKIEC